MAKDGFEIQTSIVIRVLKTRMRELQETEKELDEVLGKMERVVTTSVDPLPGSTLGREQLPEVPPDDGPIYTTGPVLPDLQTEDEELVAQDIEGDNLGVLKTRKRELQETDDR